VRHELSRVTFGDDDPLPVDLADLNELLESRPAARISTKLNWEALDDESFEGLVFRLLSDAPEYENVRWFTKTNAPDRGRDISADRVIRDSLGGTTFKRVIVQCKHWLSKSVGPSDVSSVAGQMDLWGPPRVDVVIIATSGRFTTDAVDMAERQNASDRALRIEMWPESHLEALLAARPGVVADFGLR